MLVVDKPAGPTSFDVVQKVRRALGADKAGHTGTLDPMATGVLPVCVGDATRLVAYLTDGDKAYDAVVRFGAETDTYDAQGKVVATAAVPHLTSALVEAALTGFRGSQLQLPPMFSAVKVDGKKLYEHARKGEEVERTARAITVHRLELRDLSADSAHLFVKSGKGFFVRTLAHELGKALGTLAHLSSLRRVESGPFTIAQSVPLERIVEAGPKAADWLVPMEVALSRLPALEVSAKDAQKVQHGGLVEVQTADALVRVMGPGGVLLALADVVQGKLKYRRVFVRP